MSKQPLSLRCYARHRRARGLPGGTVKAVLDAVAGGRLGRSLAMGATGTPRIANAALADAEWASTTHADRVPLTGPAGFLDTSPELGRARRHHEAARAALVEFRLRERRASLIEAAVVRPAVAEVFARAHARLMAIPERVRQRDPNFPPEGLRLLEKLLREATEELDETEGPWT